MFEQKGDRCLPPSSWKNRGEFRDQWSRADKKARKWLEDNAKDARLFGKPILEWLGEAFSDKGLNVPSDQNVAGPSLGF